MTNDPSIPLTTRPAVADDFRLAQGIHHAAYREMILSVFGRWDETEQDGYFKASWKPEIFEILFWRGEPCGQMAVVDRGDHLYVDELVVHPDYQNCGIGTAALCRIIDRAKRLGVPVRLQTRHVNLAQHLYRRVGFCDYGQTDTHILLEWKTIMPHLTSFTPGEIWPDDHGVHINAHGGGILVHHGVYYWFGEHKIEGKLGNSAQVGVHVYSSRDLYNWRDEGIALAVHDDSASDITRGCVLERPKVIYNQRTNKFVMWFHLELKGRGYAAARSGVAVSDSAVGPYQFINSFRPNAGIRPFDDQSICTTPLNEAEQARLASDHWSNGRADFPVDLIFRRDFSGGQMARDMTLFVDDDGSAYHVYASEENATLNISQLSDDYLSPAGKYVRVFPRAFNEAPALFKRAGRYYMFSSDCTGWAPNPGRVAVADSIWGPWTHLGNPCRGTEQEVATTFESQSTHVLPVPGDPDNFIYIGDRWRPHNPIDGRYIWLPVLWDDDRPILKWQDRWDFRTLV